MRGCGVICADLDLIDSITVGFVISTTFAGAGVGIATFVGLNVFAVSTTLAGTTGALTIGAVTTGATADATTIGAAFCTIGAGC